MKFLLTKCFYALALVAYVALPDRTHAQTVQLPTFHQFGIVTTIVVPTRGVAYPGANRHSGYGTTDIGPGAERGFGGRHMAGGVSVGATIIDNDALDRAVLAEAARRRGAAFDILGRPLVAGQAAADAPAPGVKPRPRTPTAVPGQVAGLEHEPLILVRPISGSRRP